MKKKYIKYIIIIGVIVIGTTAVCLLSKTVGSNKKTDDVKYKTVTVEPKDKVFINGTIKPIESKNIFIDSSKGIVDSVSVEDGQNVEAGTVLFTYRNEAITEQIEKANIQLDNYRNNREKNADKLSESKNKLAQEKDKAAKLKAGTYNNANNSSENDEDASSISTIEADIKGYEQQINTLDDQISDLENELDRLTEKEYSSEVAQMAGRVSIVGDKSIATSPYMILESNNLVVKGTVSEKDYHKIAQNQEAELLAVAVNKTVTGKIIKIGDRPVQSEVSSAAAGNSDNSVSQYEVELSIDNTEGLVNGYHVQSTLYQNDYKISIPKTALFEKDGKSYVYKLQKKKPQSVEVTYTEDGKNIIVNSGLNENDEVIANSDKVTKDGESRE